MGAKANGRVLIVDDEPNALRVLSAILKEEGYRVFEARNGDEALRTVRKEDVDAVITDVRMPGTDGMELFEHLLRNHPDIPAIFLTAYGSVDAAVGAITRGAFYYFVKPPDYVKLKGILARAVEQRQLKRELELLRRQIAQGGGGFRLVGGTPELQKILETVDAVKDSASSVLLCGETGTGKELIARALHHTGTRRDSPFVAVNCAAMPRELIESELFGYEKGAFTGAAARRIGRFEEADGGTMFLDEIGELELSLQAKLLRVLQEKEIERIGSNRKIPVNFRLVCSTNRDLQAEVRAGTFREDLFYRINVVIITVPPLRERRDDIPLLATEFVREFCVAERKVLTLSEEVMAVLRGYAWPGNVRQLRNVIERAVVLAQGRKITPRDLPEELQSVVVSAKTIPSPGTLQEIASRAVVEALAACGGNKSHAAAMLGISRKALYKKLAEMNAV